MVRSLARRVLCSARDSAAFRATVPSSAFLSPRRGTRSFTRPPRRDASHSSTAGAPSGSTGTSTSRGTAGPVASGRTVPFRLAVPVAPFPVTLPSPYTWLRKCSTSSPSLMSSTLSTTHPRWPRTRPPRT